MVDSILTNQAPIVQKPAENRSITSAAVSNASSVPEVDLAEDTIDVTPRTMDLDPNQQFSSLTQRGSWFNNGRRYRLGYRFEATT